MDDFRGWSICFIPPWAYCTSGNDKFKMTFFIFTEWESRYNHQEPQWTGPAPGGGEQNGNSQNEVNVCYRGRGEMENALHSISPSVCESVVCRKTEPDINSDDDCSNEGCWGSVWSHWLVFIDEFYLSMAILVFLCFDLKRTVIFINITLFLLFSI